MIVSRAASKSISAHQLPRALCVSPVLCPRVPWTREHGSALQQGPLLPPAHQNKGVSVPLRHSPDPRLLLPGHGWQLARGGQRGHSVWELGDGCPLLPALPRPGAPQHPTASLTPGPGSPSRLQVTPGHRPSPALDLLHPIPPEAGTPISGASLPKQPPGGARARSLQYGTHEPPYVCTHAHSHTPANTCTHTGAQVYRHTPTNMYTYLQAHAHTLAFVHTHLHTYMYTHSYRHVHT